MAYYVISGDGQRYGPAEIPTLNQWAAEGRLMPHNLLEDAATGVRVPASSVQGLSFPAAASQQSYQAPGYAQYPRGGYGGSYGGQGDITQAWVFGAFGLLCCGLIFGMLGIAAANRAEQQGHPGARAAKIFNIVVLVLWSLGLVFRALSFLGRGALG